MGKKGRTIGFVNILIIVITIAVLFSTYFCTWLNSTLDISFGKVKSDITLRHYKFTVSIAGVEAKKSIRLSESCGSSDNNNNNFNNYINFALSANSTDVMNGAAANEGKSDSKLCKLYKGSLALTVLTALGIIVSVVNAVLILVFMTCVSGHSFCFRLVTILLSVGCLCLYVVSIATYSTVASDIDDVKYRLGWFVYIVGCAVALVSAVLSFLTTNNKGYVTL